MPRPIFLSRHIRYSPRIAPPSLQHVQEAIQVTRTLPVKQHRVDYCDSVGLNYEAIELYYDTVVCLNDILQKSPSLPNSHPLQMFIHQCFDRFRSQ